MKLKYDFSSYINIINTSSRITSFDDEILLRIVKLDIFYRQNLYPIH